MTNTTKRASVRHRSLGSWTRFDVINTLIVLAVTIVTIYPLYFCVIASFSDPKEVALGHVLLWPVKFSTEAYKYVLKENSLWIGYRNTIIYTLFGTLYNLCLTIPCAYVLTKKYLPFRGALSWYFFITMYFSGGMIPTYMVVTGLGLYNSRLAMILPVLLSTYNMMICRSAMESVPEDLFENASLEGASDWYMMLHIAVPLIKPTLAVLTLYYAVARYNDFFNAMLYLGKSELQPLQMFLRRVLLMSSAEVLQQAGTAAADAAAKNTLKIRYVCIVMAAVPIFCITPFVQKYLVSGTMLGAVKG